MYLTNSSKRRPTVRRVERSQSSPSPHNTAASDRRDQPQRLFLHNTATGESPIMTPAALFKETDSTRGSSGRSFSEYSQDDASQSEKAGNSYVCGRQHQRNKSLHVNWTQEDVERMAKEIYDESIAAVHLSLLGYWICEMPQHYELARTHIRELSLDQVSWDFVRHATDLLD
jgi:hypothetical protein